MANEKKVDQSLEASIALMEKDANGLAITRTTFTEKTYCPDCRLKIAHIQPLLMGTRHECEGVVLTIKYCPSCKYEERTGTVPDKR